MKTFSILQRTALIALYLFSLGIFLSAHYVRVSRDPGLIGEELASAYRNPVYLEHHLVYDGYATSHSGTVFFWLASRLLPVSVNSARIFKICFSAASPAILAAILFRIDPQLSVGAVLYGSALYGLVPCVSWYSILAMEMGADVTFGFWLFYLGLGLKWDDRLDRLAWRFLGLILLTAWSMHFYSGSLVLIPVTWLMVAVNWVASRRSFIQRDAQRIVLLALAIGTAALLSAWPFVAFRSFDIPLLHGGGRWAIDAASLRQSVRLSLWDLFVRPTSYLIRDWLPYASFSWRGGGWIALAFALPGLWRLKRSAPARWLLLVAVLSAVVLVASGPMPGIRRGLPFIAVVCLFAALGMDAVLRRTRSSPVLSGMIVAAALAFPSATYIQTYRFVGKHYWAWLQRSFKLRPGMNYEQTVESLLVDLQQRPQTLSTQDYSFDTILFLDLLCRRRHLACVKPVITGDGIDPRIPDSDLFSSTSSL